MDDLSGFTLLPAIKGSTACLTCGCGSHDSMHMNDLLAVGFGDVTVTRDGEIIYSEQQQKENFWEGKDAESAAIKDPNHDWRVNFYGPLYGAVYQRQGIGHWVLIEKSEGFA